MANHFLDTSALIKHYHSEPGTPAVDRLWAEPGTKLFISRLGVVETVSVLAKKARSQIISGADFGLLRGRFFADLRQRQPVLVRMLVQHFKDADQLLQRHGLVQSLYALDALQLAVALDLHRRGMIDTVIAADRAFVNVALAEGLKVVNPEVP
jgi:predicted nucleic acid-binding protein